MPIVSANCFTPFMAWLVVFCASFVVCGGWLVVVVRDSFGHGITVVVSMSGSAGLSGTLEIIDGEFDPGSGRTLAACLTHASRARGFGS